MSAHGKHPRTMAPPRLPSVVELEAMARAVSHAGEPSVVECLRMLDAARVAVFDCYMPDGPGYAGPVAVVVWSGGVDLHSVFSFHYTAEGRPLEAREEGIHG